MPSLQKEALQNILDKIQREVSNYNTFVETGTFDGNTTNYVSKNFEIEVYTIELSERYYNNAVNEFKDRANVHPIFGDSSEQIPNLLKQLTANDTTIFWLDGHYSGEGTARGSKDCPLIEECKAIDNLYKAEHGLVLIDDYRLFGMDGGEDWSYISDESILECFKNHKIINTFIYEDTMVVEIKKNK